jgi:glycine/D-amino acid oxidase-like deaminating enzyme
MTTADIVVIGGGCTGASTAFHLVRRDAGRVILVERRTVGSGPTAKSSGIVRLHYSYEPLVRLAARSRDMFSHFEEITGATADFKRTGFLLLGLPRPPASAEGQRRPAAIAGIPNVCSFA